ncbi:hypothetical protein D3C87_1907130 [compost metagenome]
MREDVEEAHGRGVVLAIRRERRDERDRTRADEICQQPVAVLGGQFGEVEVHQ